MLENNRIALGTVQFGMPYGVANQAGQVTKKMAKSMLDYCADVGIDTLDTAMVYGSSERVIGSLERSADFKLITKMPSVDNVEKALVKEKVYQSLNRLGVSQVEGLLLHSCEQLLAPGGSTIYDALRELKSDGVINKVGVSTYSPDEVKAVIGEYEIDLIQMPFNLLDQRLTSSGLLEELKQANLEVHVRSVFLQGLLLMDNHVRPDKFSKWSNLWLGWREWLDFSGESAIKACLSLPLSYPEIDRVVIGADNLGQLQEIVDATQSPIPRLDLPRLICDDENLINPSKWTSL